MKKLTIYYSISKEQINAHRYFIEDLSKKFNLINIFEVSDLESIISDKLLLLGGDGSLNYLINNVHNTYLSNLKVIYIPSGTANDFARSLNLNPTSLNSKYITEILERDTYLKVPLVKFNDLKFINVATAGLPATITDSDEGLLKEHAGVFSYYLSALSKLFSDKFYKVEIEYAGNKLAEFETNGFVISQGLYAGGGIKVSPSYTANFGKNIGLLVNKKRDLINTVSSAIKIQSDSSSFEDDNIQFIKADSIVIKSDKEIPYKLDGEEVFTKEAKITKDGFLNLAIY